MLSRIGAGVLLSLLLCSSGLAWAEKLLIAGDLWCPINCAVDAEKRGIFVELAEQIFAESGIEVEYRVINWARAVHDTRRGKLDALIGAGVQDAPDFIFTPTAPGLSRMCFYASRGGTWRYQGLVSLQSVRLGAINGYSYGAELDLYLRNHHDPSQVQVMTGDHALISNLRKLRHGRIDALVENAWVMQALLSERYLHGEIVEVGCRQPDIPIYLAFAPGLAGSPRYAELFEQGLQRFREDGRLDELLRRYGIR
ncbi:substrate-binding periplasmic protein [Pseudomonas sediminis]|uniref:ABC transporter substrate-binding protein n=1 Tax=Pseudomonas sediminis TaxID=1691904 RepID=A0A2G5FIG1_9PSED|nr:transporter substrate-binding domain-containing protein [Pseudomonas sediminis]PIA67778.1 ABC transporter substrate-binding protein [Pseudomonas sediminis]